MNLAVLTGRQISKPLKIFIVSHAGEVADVTLSSLCTSKDQSVLKVCIDGVPSFYYQLKTILSQLMQIWQLFIILKQFQ